MTTYLYDLETDGLIGSSLTRIHMVALVDMDSPEREVRAYHDDPTLVPYHGPLDEGLELLESADRLIGHNLIGYDNRVLKLLHGITVPLEKTWDTLVASRLLYSDLKERDFAKHEAGLLDGRSVGSHALGAWGARLGLEKLEYDGGWRTLTQDMLTYGVRDVEVNILLADKLMDEMQGLEQVFIEEQDYANELLLMEVGGMRLDIPAAERLVRELDGKMADLEVKIQADWPPVFVPHKPYPNGNPRMIKCRYRGSKEPDKMLPFDPGSRVQLARRIQEKYNWTPTELTHSGQPKMTEDVLDALAEMYPEVGSVRDYYVVKARLATLRDGQSAYFKLVDYRGYLHPRFHHIGAVTHRSSSSRPNGQNVASVGAKYGSEIRSLFIPDEGRQQMAFDASGLELRILAHYLGRWDGGAYADVVTTGDVHQLHADAISQVVPCTRSQSKTVCYGYLYGAGDTKLAEGFGGGRKMGAAIRRAFQQRIQGLEPLVEQLTAVVEERGSITGLDGRRVGIRSDHAALNSLLQSGGAIVMRKVLLCFRDELLARGVAWDSPEGVRAHAIVHDEIQASALAHHFDDFSAAVDAAFLRTTSELNLRCPMAGEAKRGNSWLECH